MKLITRLIFILCIVNLPVLPVNAGGPGGALEGVLNATYMIEKLEIRLVNGRAEVEAAPGSAIKITTAVFGEPVFADLNGDGREDAALILVHDPGGSGTFYYVAAAIARNGNYQGINAVLLGDRVAPRKIQIRDGRIIVNYNDRRPGEPMTAQPSIAKTKYLKLNAERLESTEAPR